MADYTVVNIHDFLNDIGPEELNEIVSEFCCPINEDVEHFLRHNAAEFAKKHQSVTYLVFSEENGDLVGYFTLAVKPISVGPEGFSNNFVRKLERVSELKVEEDVYSLAAYLIAQLGKNYNAELSASISGKELLELAIKEIRSIQHCLGGMFVFLEAEEKEKLFDFYEKENGFIPFSTRENNSHQPMRQLIHTL